jgi:hypothetical protein
MMANVGICGKTCKLNSNKRWVKVINDRLLFFSTKDSCKATMSYELKECEISGKVIEESEIRFKSKFTFHSTAELKVLANRAIGKERSLSANRTADRKKSYDRSDIARQLNYMIELEHPYMQKCYIKSKYLIDSMEFYNHITNIE